MAFPLVCVLMLVISLATDPVCSQIIYASENPIAVGSDVTFFVQQNYSVTQGVWLFNNDIIVMIFSGTVTESNAWKDRITFNSTSGSLTIRSLQLEDSGLYTLQAINSFMDQVTLSVQVPISSVALKANAVNLVALNDTAMFTCSVSNGTSLSFVWLNGSSVVTARGKVQISVLNSTLTIPNVTQYDQGPFQCNVSNGVSKEQSMPLHLNISYGPNNPTMMATPMKIAYTTGDNITLSCSAESSPPAKNQWFFDGTSLDHFGPQLQLTEVTQNQSGNYGCWFHNTITTRFSKASAMIRILYPITAVMVNQTGGLPEVNMSITLHCYVTGDVTVDKIVWLKNGDVISTDNTTVLGMNNKTLTFQAIQRSDRGDYQCQAFNAVSNITSSPYAVQVIYGPDELTITGPNMAMVGSNVTFNCSASSYPPSDYTWSFNGSVVANTSEYVTPPLTLDMNGTYTCVALNRISGQNSTADKMLIVYEHIYHVQIEAQSDPAIDGQIYNLTCNATASVVHLYWMKNGSPLHADTRIVFSNENKTLTFSPLEADDTGSYTCVVISSIENKTSPAFTLTVNFGPQTPVILGPSVAQTGQYVDFNCSATSVPPSYLSWWFNGFLVAQTASLQVGPLSLNMSGEYTCVATNNVTGNNSTKSTVLTVIEPIQSVTVINNTVPINNKTFTLTCEVVGSYNSISWLKNNTKLSITNGSQNSSDQMINTMLHFTPLTLNDSGTYQCVAHNQFSSFQSSEYNLMVNYGPLSVNISGPDSVKENPAVTVVLQCYAKSRPAVTFQWFFNFNSQVISTESTVTFKALRNRGGNYTCEASNSVTNITVLRTKAVTIGVVLSLFVVCVCSSARSARACVLHSPSKGSLIFLGVFILALPVLTG